jgi:hypothetical protein
MASPQLKAGDVLDRKYRVERVLGTDGMGMVSPRDTFSSASASR